MEWKAVCGGLILQDKGGIPRFVHSTRFHHTIFPLQGYRAFLPKRLAAGGVVISGLVDDMTDRVAHRRDCVARPPARPTPFTHGRRQTITPFNIHTLPDNALYTRASICGSDTTRDG